MSRRQSWDQYFVMLARDIATRSKDPSTTVGALIVGPDREIRSSGYNGFPRGVMDTEERLNNRELKYPLTVHAEANSIVQAARAGICTKGCTIYVSGLPPCVPCATLIIQAGITALVFPEGQVIPERWRDSCRFAQEILLEAFVEIRQVETWQEQ